MPHAASFCPASSWCHAPPPPSSPLPQALEDIQRRIALLQARPSQLDEFMAYQVGGRPCLRSLCRTMHAPFHTQRLKLAPPRAPALLCAQVMHSEQVEGKKGVLAAGNQVDDMYDMLAAYEQKVRGCLPSGCRAPASSSLDPPSSVRLCVLGVSFC